MFTIIRPATNKTFADQLVDLVGFEPVQIGVDEVG